MIISGNECPRLYIFHVEISPNAEYFEFMNIRDEKTIVEINCPTEAGENDSASPLV